ncbi:unnamed protein product [Acanthoscelides obtectus]|uniref:Uncharacterized protein n=1 Tax=Acanthoscelides obtectus TaxID=200917 RepID=A0A9P0NS44_ACAOB|nr:unnamed protein product [Acanthoscelides obtectus]CAK1661984.1 hypothetical protein AOBTE_LOCUS22916 [Acanthoscelides obtectus]
MQCEDDFGVAAALHETVARPLNNLDSALNELGMLATSAKSDYLNEMYKKRYNMLTINTRYVSNVSIGFRVRPIVPHTRYKPYKCSKERHRTKSENNDEVTVTSPPKTEVDCSLDEITQLKKAKSLESIIAETNQMVDLKNIHLGKPSEVEVVSKSIQNLKVVE